MLRIDAAFETAMRFALASPGGMPLGELGELGDAVMFRVPGGNRIHVQLEVSRGPPTMEATSTSASSFDRRSAAQ